MATPHATRKMHVRNNAPTLHRGNSANHDAISQRSSIQKQNKNIQKKHLGSNEEIVLIIVAALLLIGLMTLYSATFAVLADANKLPVETLIHQLGFVAIGAILAFVIWKIQPSNNALSKLICIAWAISILGLALTVPFGAYVNGAKRWLFHIVQVSEFAKITMVLMTARLLVNWRAGKTSGVVTAIKISLMVIMPIIAFILIDESDFGSALLSLLGVMFALTFGGVPAIILLAAAAVGIIGAVLSVLLVEYRRERLINLLFGSNSHEKMGSTQEAAAEGAFAEGGIFGKGIGSGHLNYGFPEIENDYIFALVGEEMGLIGCTLIIGLFICLLFVALKVSENSVSALGRITAGSLGAMLVSAAFLNISMATGLLPTVGKALPFFSDGGSSMLSTLIIIGIILHFAAETRLSNEEAVLRRNDLHFVKEKGSRRAPAVSKPVRASNFSKNHASQNHRAQPLTRNQPHRNRASRNTKQSHQQHR